MVDFDLHQRQILTICLRRTGYRIVHVQTVPEALHALRTHTVQVLLTDLALEGTAAIELLRMASALEQQDALVTVVLSGVYHLLDQDEVDQLADYVLHQPITIGLFQQFFGELKSTWANYSSH